MVFVQIRTSVIVLLLIAIYFSCLAKCHVLTPLHKQKSLPVSDLLILPITRTGFSLHDFPNDPVTVLQEEGYIDSIQTFSFVLPPNVSLSDIRFEQASSDDNVLNITRNNSAAGANMVIGASDRGPINITTTLVFDSMAGLVRYTLVASDRRNNEKIDSISVWYRVVGMTCYLEHPSGELEIVSGEANEFVVSFEQIMNGAVIWQTFIKVFIQYADGSTSRGQMASELSNSDSLKLTSKGIRGQITHDENYCDVGRIGSKSISGKPQLSLGCGFGFYYGPGNQLAFGFIFHNYRIGSFALHFSWMGINNGHPVLQSEYLELSLRVRITGTPPLVIVGIDPISMLLRKEGGEMRTIKMINVNLHDAIAFEVRVSRVSKPFKMIPNSYTSGKSLDYVDQVSVLTEPGSGVSLNWTLFFQTRNGSASRSPYKQAKFHPSFVHLFSYDIEDLHIRSIEPQFANEDSDTTITIRGHFPYFNQDVDSISFSGTRLPQSYLIFVSRWEIRFILPKRYIFGSSYDFRVTVRIGFAESNHVLFSYLVRPTVSVRFYGVSLIAPDTYHLADCSFAMFTIAIFPSSNLVQGFTWTLYRHNADSNATSNLLDTEPALKHVDSSGQTIRLDSDMLPSGSYILKCDILLLKFVINMDIFLVRENSLALGATILPVGNQSLAEMGSTFRLTAIVNKPSCLTSNGQLLFEWVGFGQKSLYSPLLNETNNSAAIREGDLNGIRPSRLGLEFSVSREKITSGSHNVTFRAWVNGNESIFGEAKDTIHVHHGPLVAVIRSGEKRIDVNYLTTLTLYGNLSYDSSLHDERRFRNLSYHWKCLQSKTEGFLAADSGPCDDALRPKDFSVAEFMVSLKDLKSKPEIRFVRYSLTVRKDDRRSSSDSFLVEIVDPGTLPHFDEYSIELTDADGNPMMWSKTEFYKDVFINVKAASNSSWSFDLVGPLTPDFLTYHSLIDHPAYYSPPSTIESDAGSSKPLGIRANVLRPSTTYIIQITIFNERPRVELESFVSNITSVSSTSNVHKPTHILIMLRTVESVVVHMSSPKPVVASSKTYFAVYGGVSTWDNYFFYQFLLTDQSGNEYCCGGCTGMDTTYFYFSREGDYILSILLTDKHGNVVTSTTASDTIQLRDEITLFNVTTQFRSTVALNEYKTRLEDDFMFGNDRQWLQTAHDASIMVVKQHLELYRRTTKTETDQGILQNVEEGLAIERQLAQEMDIVMTIAENLTAVFCNSYPNTYFGKDGIVLLHRLSKMYLLGIESFYFLIEGASCCIKKTPSDAVVDVVTLMSTFISNLNRLARTWSKNANSRRRLLQIVGQPANAVADLNIWTGDIMAYTAASGTIDGFSYDYDIGYEDVTGHITIISASEASHLLELEVNGINRRIVGGQSDDELFYPRDSCILKLFKANGLRRRVFTFITLDNFVLLGFQDPPMRSNLVDKLYWIQIFERGPTGLLQAISFRNKAYCYCWKLPVIRLQEELENAVDDMPGLYGFYDMKNFRNDAKSKGEVYNYDYRISKTSDYNTSEGWVEGCQIDVGLVSTTVVSKSASNILDGGLTILGFSAWAIVGLVVGGVVLIMVAVVSAWLVAVQAVSESPIISSETADVYVERDIYGRGTGLGNTTMH